MGTIGDFVWFDGNQNGLRDPGEPGVGSVYIQAFDHTGNLMGEAYTDESGNYMIDYLQQTDVYLKFNVPNSYASTNANMGPDNMDSDIDYSNGFMTTKYYNVVAGEHIPNVDAGLVFGTVPVDLRDFYGEHRDNHNWLEWNVESQVNVSHYEIERSINRADNFESIGKLNASETLSDDIYNFEDYDLSVNGEYYYRIKILDQNGFFDYSEVILIEVQRSRNAKISIYPNPSLGNFSIEIDSDKQLNEIGYSLRSTDGKLLRTYKVLSTNLEVGLNEFNVEIEDLDSGVYNLHLESDGELTIKRLIIMTN